MDYREFEDQEIDAILETHYDYDSTVLLLTNLTREHFPDVRARTKSGLRRGIEDFIHTQPDNPATIYLADLAKFAFDDATAIRIEEELRDMPFTLTNMGLYAHDVCERYRMEIYNDSLTRFMELFGE